MYISIKDKDSKTHHTHTSLLSEDAAAKIKTICANERPFVGAMTFLSLYFSLELVNRVPKLKNLKFS